LLRRQVRRRPSRLCGGVGLDTQGSFCMKRKIVFLTGKETPDLFPRPKT
jgi:hypothetical protein